MAGSDADAWSSVSHDTLPPGGTSPAGMRPPAPTAAQLLAAVVPGEPAAVELPPPLCKEEVAGGSFELVRHPESGSHDGDARNTDIIYNVAYGPLEA